MRPYILITNDDGADAPGILSLTNVMKTLGEVIVVAPDGARSGQSNAITVNQPIRHQLLDTSKGVKRYSCSGTPTDCVKLALNELCEQTPDLLVSGINHGSNATINVIYSGTMGAVLEGCVNRIPSIAFSLCDLRFDADFTPFEPFIRQIAAKVLENGLSDSVCLNVNAPKGAIKGIRTTRQCRGRWVKEYDKRTDPYKREYFWLTGNYDNFEPESTDTDEWALHNGYISVVPTTIDMTAHNSILEMRRWFE